MKSLQWSGYLTQPCSVHYMIHHQEWGISLLSRNGLKKSPARSLPLNILCCLTIVHNISCQKLHQAIPNNHPCTPWSLLSWSNSKFQCPQCLWWFLFPGWLQFCVQSQTGPEPQFSEHLTSYLLINQACNSGLYFCPYSSFCCCPWLWSLPCTQPGPCLCAISSLHVSLGSYPCANLCLSPSLHLSHWN